MRSFLRFIWPKSEPVKVQIVHRDFLRINVSDWRKDERLAATARRTLSNPDVKQLIDVCRFGALTQWALSPDTPLEQRAIHAAKCEGYVLALNDLESLGIHADTIKGEPEPTFEDNSFNYEESGRG